MKTYTPEELRELDAWISEKVFNQATHKVMPVDYYTPPHHGLFKIPSYTTDYAAALMVLEKCHDKLDCEDIKQGACEGVWTLQTIYRENPGATGRITVRSETTLPLAICLFAKELFSK